MHVTSWFHNRRAGTDEPQYASRPPSGSVIGVSARPAVVVISGAARPSLCRRSARKWPSAVASLATVWHVRLTVAALSVVLVTGCGSSKEAGRSQSPSVDWERYSPGVKERIDEQAAAKDCSDLQAEYYMADRNEVDQMNETDDDHTELMAYIKAQMVKAGCRK